jgi:hypothetical protein
MGLSIRKPRAALKAFQKANGLKASGKLDEPTAEKLGVQKPTQANTKRISVRIFSSRGWRNLRPLLFFKTGSCCRDNDERYLVNGQNEKSRHGAKPRNSQSVA